MTSQAKCAIHFSTGSGTLPEHQPGTLCIDYYEPFVPPADSSGFSALSDPLQLKAFIECCNSGPFHQTGILGLYRSCTRDTAALNEDDLAALTAISTQGQSIALLIEPRSSQKCKEHLFLTRGGEVVSTFGSTPANRRLAGVETERQSGTPVTSLARQDISASEMQEAGRVLSSYRSWRWQWVLSSVAVVALLISGFVLLRAKRISDNFARDSRLGLNLSRDGSDWRVTWNPDSPILRHATKGLLIISDGTLDKDLNLDVSDLRSGAILYSSATNNVVFTLEVETDESPVPAMESVRVAAELPASPILIHPTVPSSEAKPVGSEKVSHPAMHLANPTETGKKQNPSIDVSDPVPGIRAKSPEANLSRLPITNKQLVPEPLALPISTSEKAPATSQQLSVPADLVGKGASVPLLGAQPPSELASSRRVEPPQLIERHDPVYPRLANGLAGSVSLQFVITNQGTVRDVKIIKGNPVLAKAALQAVQMWRYNPGRVNGSPIETEGSAIITFNPEP